MRDQLATVVRFVWAPTILALLFGLGQDNTAAARNDRVLADLNPVAVAEIAADDAALAAGRAKVSADSAQTSLGAALQALLVSKSSPGNSATHIIRAAEQAAIEAEAANYAAANAFEAAAGASQAATLAGNDPDNSEIYAQQASQLAYFGGIFADEASRAAQATFAAARQATSGRDLTDVVVPPGGLGIGGIVPFNVPPAAPLTLTITDRDATTLSLIWKDRAYNEVSNRLYRRQ